MYDWALPTGPGTAPTGRPHAFAHVTVLRAPERAAASTMIVAPPRAAIRRFRARKRIRVGCSPGGYSDTSRPPSRTRDRRPSWERG